MKGFFDDSNRFLEEARVDEDDEDESSRDNDSEKANQEGCFKWMMKDKTNTSGTYVHIKTLLSCFYEIISNAHTQSLPPYSDTYTHTHTHTLTHTHTHTYTHT